MGIKILFLSLFVLFLADAKPTFGQIGIIGGGISAYPAYGRYPYYGGGYGRSYGGYPYGGGYGGGYGGYRRPFTPPFGRPFPIAVFGG
ncbi:neuropeptide-like protein 31 [Culicoides brevitarsis]|uniref:neuropeptide-like protein 31 n=1 Tax=Culicoides brevitarsis TaxID=469753 RepID=UPI00307C6587